MPDNQKRSEIKQPDKSWIKTRVLEYLRTHRILTMATADKNGIPDATALEYANDEFTALVSLRPGSKKITNIQENPHVFYEIHDDIEITWDNVKNLEALQVLAEPVLINPGNEKYKYYFDLMEAKFPVFKRIPRNKRVILLFKPKIIWFLNYKDKMFNRDELRFWGF